MKERWKLIENFPDYEVSNLARIRSWKRKKPRILHPHLNNRGYYRQRLHYDTNDGSNKQVLVHRLVAEAWVKNPFNLPEINHIDFNTKNNLPKNLEFCERSGNIRHSFKGGRMQKTYDRLKALCGEKCNLSKLTTDIVIDIKTSPLSYRALADKYNISRSHVWNLKAGKRWKHLNEHLSKI